MKKTTDGRIIDKRVVLERDDIRKLIFSAKEKDGLTWKELARELRVCEQTASHDWINKGNTIPLSIFNRLCTIAGIDKNYYSAKMIIKDSFWGQRLKKGVIKTKAIKIPDINSEKFAEFYGILLGDGCVFSNSYGLAISADKILEDNYFNSYIRNLIYDLFGVYPSFYYSKKFRSINCFLYSKLAAEFMVNLGFPKGKKINGNLVIPPFIFRKKKLLAKCIGGLMDTDGSLSGHPHSKIMIHLSIPNQQLRKSALRGLKTLSIKGGEFNKGIMIYGEEKVRGFYNKIGFSNLKNIIKYNNFIKNGKVPSSKEVEMFIRENNRF